MVADTKNLSRDGYEHHMQVNHLAPALLSLLMLPSLLRGSPSRVVMVNSVVSHWPLCITVPFSLRKVFIVQGLCTDNRSTRQFKMRRI